VTVAGNHDRDLVLDQAIAGTSKAALHSQAWTRRVLTPDNLAWLAGLPQLWVEPEQYVAVHGSFLAHAHINGYVTRTLLDANLRTIAAHAHWPRLGLCAHTHAPMVGVLLRDGRVTHANGKQAVRWPEDASVVLVNPGSVGQPRDGDPRASFALIDLAQQSVSVLRVPYDIDATVRAFEGTGLPPAHAQRLLHGK
jgi:diadenosine tetraphosphatase ApaH/serine/threonine PP2A family protein phosphatase